MPVPYEVDFSQYQLSEEQKFLFDLKGYIVIPNVLSPEQIEAIREQVLGDMERKENRTAVEQKAGIVQGSSVPGGAAEAILKSPVVKGTLKELIGSDFRLDHVFTVKREKGQGDHLGPHQGGPMRSPHFHYHYTEGQAFAGLTRMVVELNDVGLNDGGTMFLSGSHKSNMKVPKSLSEKKDHYGAPFEGYEAPAGSIVFFSENTCHVGPVWQNPDHPRISILFAFCNIGMRWHRHSNVSQEVIDGLSAEGRWYFRDIWPWDNHGGNGGRNLVIVEDDGSLTVSP